MMRVVVFVLLAVVLALVPCATGDAEASIRRFFYGQTVVPTSMYGFDAGGSMLLADIHAGSPPRMRRYVLAAIEGPTALLKYDPQKQMHQFEASFVNQELFYIAGQRIALPYVYDSAAVASFNCSNCDGVIPIGKGSLLWNGFNDVTITANWVAFDDDSIVRERAFERVLACAFPDTALCTVDGSFNGSPTKVQFGFRTYKTLVPRAMFQAYLSTLHPDVNDEDEWPEIIIGLDATLPDNSPFIDEFTIAPRHVIGTHLGLPNALTIAPHDGDTVILGTDVLRSIAFFWNRPSGAAAIHRIQTNRGYSAYAVFSMMIVLGILFYERKGALVFRATPEFYTSLGARAMFRIVVDIAILVSPAVALLDYHVWMILGEEQLILLLCVAAYGFYGFWAVTTGYLMWRSDSGTHGWSDVVHRVRIDPPYGQLYYIPATNYTDAGIAEGRVTRAGLARITAARRASYDSLLLLALFILSIETRLYDFTGAITVAVSVFWFYTAMETSVLFLHLLHWRTRTYAWAFYISWLATSIVLWIVLWVYVYTPAVLFFVPATPVAGFLTVIIMSILLLYTASQSATVLYYDYWAFRRQILKKVA